MNKQLLILSLITLNNTIFGSILMQILSRRPCVEDFSRFPEGFAIEKSSEEFWQSYKKYYVNSEWDKLTVMCRQAAETLTLNQKREILELALYESEE